MAQKEKSVTTKISGFYAKVDKISKMLNMKTGKEKSMKFRRFVEGVPILKKYGIGYKGEEVEHFLEELINLINQSVAKKDNKDYINNQELFDNITTFFEYV